MALAWAAQQKQDPALSALLGAEPGGYSDSTAPAAAKEEELPTGHILVFTLVLPDGLGDLIFGENAVGELLEEGPVAWVRCHVSEEQVAPGEELVKAVASSLRFNLVISGKKNIHAALDPQRFEKLWVNAKERFLAPWIFGLSEADEAILDIAKKTSKPFWALTEYGRSMGNIHTYSEGLGHQVPTGWTADGGPGGVFRSILRASRTGTAWRRILLEHCGLDQKMDDRTKVRLWWFYSRKDDEKKHSFRSLENKASDEELPSHVDMVSKVIPIDSAGKVARGNEKTSGEKLAEQLFQAASDPSFKPNVDVTCAEVAAGSAGQLSQFFWDSGLLTGNKDDPTAPVVDIIVAPNVFTARRQASAQGRAVARVKQVDLVKPDGSTNVCTFPPSRKIFICSTKIPRSEMRTFLEECEEPVYTTGDQSLAEAMWMGKVPCVKPDAKVQQWQLALMAKCAGTMESVPDLGVVMRQLTKDDSAREAARAASKRRSDECEKNIIAQLGAPPSHWNPTHKVLARSGMLG